MTIEMTKTDIADPTGMTTSRAYGAAVAERVRDVGPIDGLVVVLQGGVDGDRETRLRIVAETVEALRRGAYSPERHRNSPGQIRLEHDRPISSTEKELPYIDFGRPLHGGMDDDGFDAVATALAMLCSPAVAFKDAAHIVSALDDLATIHKDASTAPRHENATHQAQFAPTPFDRARAAQLIEGSMSIHTRQWAITGEQAHVETPTIGGDIVAIPTCIAVHVSVRNGRGQWIQIGPLHGSCRMVPPGSSMVERSFGPMETLRVVERLRREFPA
jgi:hypothetical protein